MRKLFFSFIITLLLVNTIYGQLSNNDWLISAGLQYPRYYSSNTNPANQNYGAFLSIQKNITEDFNARFGLEFVHLENTWTSVLRTLEKTKVNSIIANLDLLYTILHNDDISPYLLIGGGLVNRMLNNYASTSLSKNDILPQLNFGIGSDFQLFQNMNLRFEYVFHQTFNSDLDGAIGIGESNGKDSYYNFKLGVNFNL